jgi:hypothetical protein
MPGIAKSVTMTAGGVFLTSSDGVRHVRGDDDGKTFEVNQWSGAAHHRLHRAPVGTNVLYLVPIAGGSVWSRTCQISTPNGLLAGCRWLISVVDVVGNLPRAAYLLEDHHILAVFGAAPGRCYRCRACLVCLRP